jgi:hypothetical protein
MRARPCLLLTSLLFSALVIQTAAAQEELDVIYLKDGSRYAGSIVELKPNQSVTFRTTNGMVYVFDWARIDRIAKEKVDASGAPAPEGLESWYMYAALGAAFNSYPSTLQSELDGYVKEYDASHLPLAIEILGFYWPLGDHQTILGFVLSGSADRYTFTHPFISTNTEASVQVNQYLFSGSIMHFWGEVPGDGVFLRADAGVAGISRSGNFVASSTSFGVGFLAGAGYGLPVSDETRLLFQASYSYKSASEIRIGSPEGEAKAYQSFSLTVGVLW